MHHRPQLQEASVEAVVLAEAVDPLEEALEEEPGNDFVVKESLKYVSIKIVV